VYFGVACPFIQTSVEMVKKGKRIEVMFPAFALERTTIEPKERDRAHALSAHVSCIALAAITFILAPWNF
jgi:hypothetical protein